jgi:hypothetical protein
LGQARSILPHFNLAAIGCGVDDDDPANQLARALIAAHGRKALTIAKKALADDVRSMGQETQIAAWIAVIEAIKSAQPAKPLLPNRRHVRARLRQWRPEKGESAEGC